MIQDADLEYDPNDWDVMYDLIANRKVADVVYGSRFYGRPHRSLYYHHYLANRLITVLFNLLYNQMLTDIETCYKMMRREVLQSLHLTTSDFGIEVEISARIAKQRTLANLRTRNLLLRPDLPRGKEDQLEGRSEGALVPRPVQVLNLYSERPQFAADDPQGCLQELVPAAQFSEWGVLCIGD